MTRDTTIHHRPSVSDEIETKLSQLNLNTEEDGLDLDNSPSDSESEDDVNSQQAKIKQQREAQKNKFKSWISQQGEKAANEEIKSAIQAATDDELSVRSLMSKQESAVIITDPREYQLELYDKAKKQNTIAVLDTGSGKTLIAVLLLRHVIDQELTDRSIGKKPRISFFLVDCVTLVFQQFAVLECNLDQKIERFCGEMGCDLWVKDTWMKHFAENMVIVCTAEILNQCLMHAFIKIKDINLLIFDEAHHAKKNHAYARIIKDYYIAEPDPTRRPRVFGMTASPVDAREDVVEAAKRLEVMLDCQIATASDLSLVQASISRPNERILEYEKLQQLHVTSLYAELEARFGEVKALSEVFASAKTATSELGEWCGDHWWLLAFADTELCKIQRKIEKRSIEEEWPVRQRDAELDRLEQAKKFINAWNFPSPASSKNSLSPKVLLLKKYLNFVFERPCDTRCIVFVKKRYTAKLLLSLLDFFSNPNLRTGLLVGTRRGQAGDVKISFRQQVLTINKFRKGELNCLIATSIAEEGLDIPDCNLIIRFDLYETLIQYIQSRGRARHLNSKYIHMIEQGNVSNMQVIQDVREGEEIMRQFCAALPADRLLQGNKATLENALRKEKLLRKYIDRDSGATLTYESSLVVLSHFLGCLPHSNDSTLQANFVMTIEHNQYVCEVILPEVSPIRSATGLPSSKKLVAKKSAAFQACLLLRQDGHLDENLIPTYHKYLPAMRNAHLALNMKSANTYNMIVKPSLWENSRGSCPNYLYLTVLELETPEDLNRPYQPLALLTRTCLPQLPSFTLNLQAEKASELRSISFSTAIDITEQALAKLNAFTLRIYKDMFNKKFEENVAEMSYWLAPIVKDLRIGSDAKSPRTLIDWPVVEEVYEKTELTWDLEKPHSYLADRYLVDRWDGGRRFFSIGVVPGMRASDPVPANAAAYKYNTNILDYTVSLFKKSRERAKWNPNQPVLLADRVRHHLNWLDELPDKDNEEKTTCYLCPEPLLISALPISVVSMGYLFPAIITRIESYLIALETCDMLDLSVVPALALEAITKDSDNTEEHREKQTHVQRGMGKNYERLEFIGDCFLKMATSISLFAQNPDNSEFDYHVKRMLLICNKNLFKTAMTTKIYQYVRTKGFSRRNWYPQGIKLLEGKGHKKRGTEVQTQRLGDKTIADVCEALIGASFLSYRDSKNMDMAVKAVSALVSSPDHDISSWAGYYKRYMKPPYQVAEASASELDLADKVAQEHDYRFRYPRLACSAFLHPSYPSCWSNRIPCYQRLEFLGDALLDMVCVDFLYHRYPDQDPQWLTEHKMAMVSNKFLAALSVKLGFHRHIRATGTVVESQNREFVTDIQDAEAESNGACDYWMAAKTPPKSLSDVVEAYIGAVFVDSEFNYHEVERFFNTHIKWFFEDMHIYDTFASNHPTTFLHNLLMNTFGCLNYRVMAEELPSLSAVTGGASGPIAAAVMVHNEIVAYATASSGRNAKTKASAKAVNSLDGMLPFEFRQKFGCDCKMKESAVGKADGRVNPEIGSAI